MGSVAVVDDIFFGKLFHQFARNGKTAEPRIENANRPVVEIHEALLKISPEAKRQERRWRRCPGT